jgi:protein ImuB
VHADNLVVLDATGLAELVGDGRALGASLRRGAAGRGLYLRIGVAATRAAALLIVQSRSGLTVIEPGQEAAALAPLPIDVLRTLARRQAQGVAGSARRSAPAATTGLAMPAFALLSTVRRWGVRTLGDLAEQSTATLQERLGPGGLALQRFAHGQDAVSAVPAVTDQQFESTLALERPVQGLEPLSFVLSRVFETLCARLTHAGAQAAMVRVHLRLVTGEIHACQLTLASPTRESKALRTLARLDLEMRPPRARVAQVAVAIQGTPTGACQISLLDGSHASPARTRTLMSRLTALVGERRCGSPVLQPVSEGGFAMRVFSPTWPDSAVESRVGG